MMRVAFGTTALARGLKGAGVDGIGSVTRELLGRLPAASGIARLQLLPFEYATRPSGLVEGAVAAGVFSRQAMLALSLGLSFGPMRTALGNGVDLVHATDHLIPRLRGVPVLATLMDAIPIAHPEWVSYRFKALTNALWRMSSHWADHVVTISDFSRAEIARHFRIPDRRISVMPLGVDERWFERADQSARDGVRTRYRLPERFFLFVGTLQPRKNLDMLLRAHARLPLKLRAEVPLIVVGREGWGCAETVARLKDPSSGHVRWLSYVPHEDLPVLMNMALALVFPSLYEGFGLPVLEAFAAGVPVIASNATSVPEVTGDAALLVDPVDEAAWAEAMEAVTASSELCAGLRSNGAARARAFSWDQAAASLGRIYTEVAGRA